MDWMRRMNELRGKRSDALEQATAALNAGDNAAFSTHKAEVERLNGELANVEFMLDQSGVYADSSPTNPLGVLSGAEATLDIGGGRMVKAEAVRALAGAVRSGIVRGAMNEGTNADGGYTVPKDIETLVRQWRDDSTALIDYVDASPTDKSSGTMIYQARSTVPGFATTAELAAIKLISGPQFEPVNWSVSKYTGALPASNELLEDSDANITGIITDWMGRNARATENRLILAALRQKSATALTTLDGLRKTLNTVLGPIYKPVSAIYTNEFGMDFLDSLKDTTGRQLLNPDPTDNAKFQLRAGTNILRVIEIPSSTLANNTASSANKVPFIMGSLKDALLFKQRRGLTIRVSREGTVDGFNALEQDAVLFVSSMRMGCTQLDSRAWVHQELDLNSVTAAAFAGN